MKLFAVVIEDLRRRVTDRVLLYAAEQPDEAEAMARRFFVPDGKSSRRYRFSAQPITEVSGPGDVTYRIILRRLRGSD